MLYIIYCILSLLTVYIHYILSLLTQVALELFSDDLRGVSDVGGSSFEVFVRITGIPILENLRDLRWVCLVPKRVDNSQSGLLGCVECVGDAKVSWFPECVGDATNCTLPHC